VRIDDPLDMSRISRGKIGLRKRRVELAEVIRGAVESSRPLIDRHGHELSVVLPPEPVHLGADAARLAQVFMNLPRHVSREPGHSGRPDK
jgi:signal transduction histidine kinase